MDANISPELRRERALRLPDLEESQVARHYTYLSTLNHGVDSGLYPLGSCTMKYNYKILEKIASYNEFLNINPWQEENSAQGTLSILYELGEYLSEIFGYAGFTLQPVAGAHGEHTGLLIIKAFLAGRDKERNVVLIPDTAHGTNPASAVIAGFEVRKVVTGEDGNISLDSLRAEVARGRVAALMLTNPSTLGLFETNIKAIAEIVHKAGGLLYYDGANANALMGLVKPGDMGFDVCHINLHKTFGTPHGGGGPGAGPVGVKDFLLPYLPGPVLKKLDNKYLWDLPAKSIGRVHSFHGNILVLIKAYAYILLKGSDGLAEVSKKAIINANYLQAILKKKMKLPYDRFCMHEFVLSASILKRKYGVSALDIAKRLIDYGVHPPTIYFPLIVAESLMLEPTESESRESLDEFVEIFCAIIEEAETNIEKIKSSPNTQVVGRLDEVKAVKDPKLTAYGTE